MRLLKSGKSICILITCLIIALALMLSGVACSNTNEPDIQEAGANQNAPKESVTLIACSDFQNENGNDAGKIFVKRILRSIKSAGYDSIDGFFCAGDYDLEYDETAEGIQALKEAVQKEYEELDDDRMIFVQGNHDNAGASGLSMSGANDTLEYGVYVIHEDDFPSDGGVLGGVERIANNLKSYLKKKAESNNKKPIFVISHVPLHYSMRTYKGNVGVYAEYIFEVLNQCAEEGQNIIYLYGHNHNTWGYDDYLGGSSVYLIKGDTIYISQIDKSLEVPNAKELQFTYMNAGYIGYSNSANAGADRTLSMTVFHIEGENVKIERISTRGICNLKAKGVWSEYSSETAATYRADDSYLEKEYTSPQHIAGRATEE